MSYSCVDFTDSILDALKIDVPEEHWDNPSGQADLALAEIERLQASDAIKARLLDMLDRIHARLDVDEGIGAGDGLFNEIGCLIAEAKGEYKPEES